MNPIKRLLQGMGIMSKPVARRRAEHHPMRGLYAGAVQTRYSKFAAGLEASHQEIRKSLRGLRAHSRELVKNGAYGARFVGLMASNVVGPNGITLEEHPHADEFLAWGAACSADGRKNWVEVQQQVMETVVQDGECFVHVLRGFPHNKAKFALEIIDADRIDDRLNEVRQDGTRVVMGIHVDKYSRRLGYYVTSGHPADHAVAPVQTYVPASDVIHVFDEARVDGLRGTPWLSPVMVPMSMLQRLLVVELEAANWDAERVASIKESHPSLLDEDGKPREYFDDEGNPIAGPVSPALTAASLQAEHGSDHLQFIGTDPGTEMEFHIPAHPNPNLPAFAMDLRKMIAAGLNVSYHSLVGDMSDSNFAAGRLASLAERDRYQALQAWFIAGFCQVVFDMWEEWTSATTGRKRVSESAKWWPRSWQLFNPLQEAQASLIAVRSGLSTHAAELGARGLDWRKVFAQQATERKEAARLGLRLDLGSGIAQPEPEPVKEDK